MKTSARAKAPKHEPAAVKRRKRPLTDAYAAEARKDTLRRGDELSELEPVGRKPARKRRAR